MKSHWLAVFLIASIVQLHPSIAQAVENCHSVPIFQCVITVPRGTWISIDNHCWDTWPSQKNESRYCGNGNNGSKFDRIGPASGFRVQGADWTLLGAKNKAINACAYTATGYYLIPGTTIEVGQQTSTYNETFDKTFLSNFDGCEDFLSKHQTAMECEKGTFAHCED